MWVPVLVALMDATEVRLRRPPPRGPDGIGSSDAKSQQHAVKVLMMTDVRGRLLFCRTASIVDTSRTEAELYRDTAVRLAALGHPLLTIDTTDTPPDHVAAIIAGRIVELAGVPPPNSATNASGTESSARPCASLKATATAHSSAADEDSPAPVGASTDLRRQGWLQARKSPVRRMGREQGECELVTRHHPHSRQGGVGAQRLIARHRAFRSAARRGVTRPSASLRRFSCAFQLCGSIRYVGWHAAHSRPA
jgi:hypothetical protein